MRIVISPAKKLDESTYDSVGNYTTPQFLKQAKVLIGELRQKDSFEITELMHLSMNLADLNTARFQKWHTPFKPENAKPAIFTFAGDVYQGLDSQSLSQEDISFAQTHLRILSGLYGVLRPLDLMQAYRLEMGTKLANPNGKNLYEFWGDKVTQNLNKELKGGTLINLASSEYFKSIQAKHIKGTIITPEFKEFKNGSHKVIGIFAKKARGLMARYIIQHQITEVEAIKDFAVDGYAFNPSLSNAKQWVFSR
ncbi:MAG: hypothetical protein AUK35_04235 [Zetaproteobacteria bacterium CG2_30_46_52]|nr:MAG: hypothetical protein AUK35_04235 [Zetaproteobacteria bacterium CG2_30_46_52]